MPEGSSVKRTKKPSKLWEYVKRGGKAVGRGFKKTGKAGYRAATGERAKRYARTAAIKGAVYARKHGRKFLQKQGLAKKPFRKRRRVSRRYRRRVVTYY